MLVHLAWSINDVFAYWRQVCSVLIQQHAGNEDKRQWVNLLNRAQQKSRAFYIEVVAELLLDVCTQFTPTTPVSNTLCCPENINIYYTALFTKFFTYYKTISKQQDENTFNLSWSGRFADSNKTCRAPHIFQVVDKLYICAICMKYMNSRPIERH